MTLTSAGNLPQDPTRVMEMTLKSNRFLSANIKAVKHSFQSFHGQLTV